MLEIIIVALVLGIDQLSKYLTDAYLMPLGTTYPLWDGVFHLTSVHNTGAAFGMLAGGRWFFIVIASVACAGIAVLLFKHRSRIHTFARVCLALIFAGAVGNLIDRSILAYVRDMLDFRLMQFAVFNVADSAVTVGASLLAIDILFGKSRTLLDDLERKKKPEDQEVKIESDSKQADEDHNKSAQEQPEQN